ncbi:MAG TPA: NAD(P)-dependent oxidoreductase [Gammaproteobacteria bacterium]|nr:NAD(P)-dependent oxidoreductase [Gammaproteobacteria bacterium]
MRIGIPREIKSHEGRVALLPLQVKRLIDLGHSILVQRDAGILSDAQDSAYVAAGASIADSGEAVYAGAELIVKVKEILPAEFGYLRPEHVIFTNIHGAVDRRQVDRLLEVGLTAIAAEETHEFGSPNSVLAGEIGALEGVRLVLAPHGGTGRHFMMHFGAPAAKALVIGLGGVGRGALRTLLGLGLSVVGIDVSRGARREAMFTWHKQAFQAFDISELRAHLEDADLVVNCVLWDKQRKDHLITREMLKRMKPRAVIADISCDPAGAIETTRATKWEDPVYEVDGIRHFCVDNIPGAAPATASAGYAEALLPFVSLIAEHGPIEACRKSPWLARGLTCAGGELILEEAGRFQNRPFTPLAEFLRRRAPA